MTVTTSTSRVSYAGNGSTTVFTVPFYFLANADLTVIRTSSAGVQTTLVLSTDYAVTGAGVQSGGTATMVTAPASGETLTILRSPAITQSTDYLANDPFPAETHERALDRLTMIAQRQNDLNTRSFRLADGDVSGASTTLPTPTANNLVGWNASGSGLQNVSPQTLATIVATGSAFADRFTGDGTTVSYTLTANPGALANLDVSVAGVTQLPTIDYTWSGTTLTFVAAPPAGVSILARYTQALPQGTVDWSAVTNKPTVSPKDYGAQGDGVTNDTASMLAALQSGKVVDGGGLTYAISGTMQPTSFVGLRNANFIQLAPTTASVATLWIYNLSNWFIENCRFDMGSTINTGANDDSSKSALRVGNATGNYNLNFRISNVTATGNGNGSRIQVRQSKRFVIENCLVRDCVAGFTPDPTNDIINGFDISDCANFTVANCSVNNLQCVLLGVNTFRYTRGFLFTEVRDCAIVGCNSTNNDQCYDFSGSVISGTTPAYYEGNRRFTISGCTANNAQTWGFKFANVTHDGLVTGCIANNAGSGGFVISAPAAANTTLAYATGNIDIVGCKVVNVLGTGGAGVGAAQGFRVMAGSNALGTAPNTHDTYPRGVRFRSCEVIDNQAVPTTVTGFASDVTKLEPLTAGYNTNIVSTAVGCSVGPGVTNAFTNIGPSLCYVTGSAVQSIPNNAFTSLTWNVNTIDNQGLHSTTTNADRIYIKEAGTYRISAQLYFAANATGVRIARIVKNGSALNRTSVTVPVNSASVASTMHSSILDRAVPGDYYAVDVYQNSGGALDHANNEANFMVQKVD